MKTALAVLSLALGACAGSFSPMQSNNAPALTLADAESAFAAHSVREDMRVAFMAHFENDGVFVRNGWTVSTAYLAGQPAPPIVLDWRPVYTEVAHSGEMGLSTGPWKLTSKSKPETPPSYGQFVSIWRRGEAPWRVAVDLGISHPTPALWQADLRAVTLPGTSARPKGGAAEAEAVFAAEAKASGLRTAHLRAAADDLRFYRNGVEPLLGKTSAVQSQALMDERYTWTVERAETARSGDFGYARGHYAALDDPTKPLGWYLRVWRAERGEWRVILDVTNRAPPPKS